MLLPKCFSFSLWQIISNDLVLHVFEFGYCSMTQAGFIKVAKKGQRSVFYHILNTKLYINILFLFLLFLFAARGCFIICSQCQDYWKATWAKNNCSKESYWPGTKYIYTVYGWTKIIRVLLSCMFSSGWCISRWTKLKDLCCSFRENTLNLISVWKTYKFKSFPWLVAGSWALKSASLVSNTWLHLVSQQKQQEQSKKAKGTLIDRT